MPLAGDCLTNGILIQKSTLLLALGLLVVMGAGAYAISTAPSPAQAEPDSCLNQDAQYCAIQQPKASGADVQEALPTGGCGCGGVGGTQAKPSDPPKAVQLDSTNASAQKDVQDIYIKAKNDGTYDKAEVTVEAGSPVRLHFTADPDAGCGRQMVIYGLNIRAVSTNGEEDLVEFIPQKAGTYEYNCGMRMWRAGRLVVV